MTIRDRILAVYRGEAPDRVPFMLDLSHWFYHRRSLPWDLSVAYEEPEYALIDYHRQNGVGFYLPNLAAFYTTGYPNDVRVSTEKRSVRGTPEIAWRVDTPSGSIERTRIWNEETYAWGINRLGVRSSDDLRVFQYAMSRRQYRPYWDRYRRWADYVGDDGVLYLPLPYSAMGHLLHYWMGVEAAVFAASDWPELLREVVDAVNANQLELVDLACESPAEVVIMGDNFSSDVQPPRFFETWSRSYYAEAIRRLHAARKFVAVHIDGRLKGAIRMIRDVGADCADAVTPAPMGDLSTAKCREEAGDRFILSGGVPPDLWMPSVPIERFADQVRDWLAQGERTFRFIANAGDQVPPGADEGRIQLMRSLVEQHGKKR